MQRISPQIKHWQHGFTLVEVAIIAPVLILTIGAIVTIIVGLTSSSMQTTARAELQNDVLAALDRMEEDVRISTSISGVGSQLKLDGLATNKNPTDSTRLLIDKNTCLPATTGVLRANALQYTTTYSVASGMLNRTTTLGGCAGNTANVWQNLGNELLLEANTVTLTTTMDGTAAVQITLSAERTVAGETIRYTGKMYTRSLNN